MSSTNLLTSGAVARRVLINDRVPHRTTITRWFRLGILPGVRVGRGWRISLVALNAWLDGERASEYGARKSA